ncbi:PTS sugar transporter subunit IIA [Xylocopilactobacillus apis]|uniref:PTS galactitol transporter subunit IIA n=1 Tax=Xylocopilactobacillus apis TaxID=2932183 RepID=A0AAU9CTX6_9LACO|nr:PTS sugar transporter subunit IIA [Xylocopilactobacillus apis]BDR57427.1 PTS galactitol transporter subunit IIA [Xylocopilactobacillus apis]
MDLILDQSLFFAKLDCRDSIETIKFLSNELTKNGYVKSGYSEAIVKREREYPTGLPSREPGVAIPHADYQLVNKTTIAVATLKEPVMFYNMEAVKKTVPVQIVIMMAIKEPHGQVEMLQKIVGIIQDDNLRNKIFKASKSTELLSLIQDVINK